MSYTLFDERGEAVDRTSSDQPLTYVHGYAQIIPGLERGLEGLHAGEQCEIIVDPDEAFGHRDEDAIFEVDKGELPVGNKIEVGDELVGHGADGEPLSFRVIEILADGILVDTNHPLAGQKVRFSVQVDLVRDATDDEIAAAQTELEERVQLEQAAECSCGDHASHTKDTQPLITLTKRQV